MVILHMNKQERRRRFVLAGNDTFVNRGCEALLRSTMSILEREFGPSDFVNCPHGERHREDARWVRHPGLSHIPYHHLHRWTMPWLRLQVNKRLLGCKTEFPYERSLHKADAVLAMGGDRISLDYYVPRREFEMIEAVLKARRPMVLWGASLGPFSRMPDVEKYAFDVFRRVDLICARETITQRYLAEHGVTDNVKLVTDPAFVMEPAQPDLPPELSGHLDTGAFGLNFSPLLSRFVAESTDWTRNAAECLREVDRRIDMPIVLLPHAFYSDNNDHTFLATVLAACGKTRNPVFLVAGERFSAPQLKWIISRFKAFAGARTHATVAALSTCVPTISIGYSVKSRGINQDIFGHLDWLTPSDAMTPAGLAEQVHTLLARRTEVAAHLQRFMPAYKDNAWLAARHLRSAGV